VGICGLASACQVHIPVAQESKRYGRILVRAGIALGIVAALLFGVRILNAFRLDETDSVYDYHRATVDDRVRFRMSACNNGACLTYRDWQCGFDNGESQAFEACLDAVLASAKPWVSLDDVRKFCGNRTMRFIGPVFSNPDRCKEAGGEWGTKSPAPLIAF
jgi:hypothetical protein